MFVCFAKAICIINVFHPYSTIHYATPYEALWIKISTASDSVLAEKSILSARECRWAILESLYNYFPFLYPPPPPLFTVLFEVQYGRVSRCEDMDIKGVSSEAIQPAQHKHTRLKVHHVDTRGSVRKWREGEVNTRMKRRRNYKGEMVWSWWESRRISILATASRLARKET